MASLKPIFEMIDIARHLGYDAWADRVELAAKKEAVRRGLNYCLNMQNWHNN